MKALCLQFGGLASEGRFLAGELSGLGSDAKGFVNRQPAPCVATTCMTSVSIVSRANPRYNPGIFCSLLYVLF